MKCATFGRDSCVLHVIGNNAAGGTRIKRTNLSGMAQENILNNGIWTAIEDIIGYGVSAFWFQRKGQRFAGFVLSEANFSCPPVNAAQLQPDNITGPQTALCSQNHHGIPSSTK